jgi:uncharacterized protein involved in exopolysaccharide biosynthesis
LNDAKFDRHGEPGTTTGVTLYGLAAVALRHYRLLLLPFGLAFAAGVIALMLPKQYTAESVFLPAGGLPTDGRIGSLAAQFDLNLGGLGGGSDGSPDLLAAVLTSREVLRGTADFGYRFEHEGSAVEGNLAKLLEVQGRTERELSRNVEKTLKNSVGTEVNVRVGTVTLRTASRWPELSEQINRRMITLLQQFELERRHASTAAETEFLKSRVADAQRELESAELELQKFLEVNVSFGSPQLSFQEARLQRRVNLKQSVFQSLAQSYERARVEESRTTSPIALISRPEGSVERTGPPRTLIVMVAFILGFVIAVAIASAREYAVVQRKLSPVEYDTYMRLRQGLVDGLRGRRPGVRAHVDS